MQRKFRFASFILFLSIASFTWAAPEKLNSSPNYLVLTDIHFNPFDTCVTGQPCQLVKDLNAETVDQWENTLNQYQTKPVSYGTDTNYPSLKSALAKASAVAKNRDAQFVLLLGDYLSHDYRANYQAFTGDTSQADYQAFVKKTMTFVTAEFAKAFPSQNVYMTVGNNDSYDDDYVSNPVPFYQDMADLWSSVIKDPATQAKMKSDFVTGGYYSVDLPGQPAIRLIMLNTVLFSQKAKGDNVDQLAQQELDWLQQELANATTRSQKVLLGMHIPPGIDVFSTLKKTDSSVVELWKPTYTQRFQDELQQYSDHIMGLMVGHFHMDFFEVLTNGYNNPIPVSGTLAVSPMFGNNPGFKLFVYNRKTFEIRDYQTFVISLSDAEPTWQEEYDFKQVYIKGHPQEGIVEGMDMLQPNMDERATHYMSFYDGKTNSQPITKKQKWLPYYWCQVHEITAIDYTNCMGASKAK